MGSKLVVAFTFSLGILVILFIKWSPGTDEAVVYTPRQFREVKRNRVNPSSIVLTHSISSNNGIGVGTPNAFLCPGTFSNRSCIHSKWRIIWRRFNGFWIQLNADPKPHVDISIRFGVHAPALFQCDVFTSPSDLLARPRIVEPIGRSHRPRWSVPKLSGLGHLLNLFQVSYISPKSFQPVKPLA